MRLMRDRNDAWPLMFDRIYASATPSSDTKPNALLLTAIEGRFAARALEVGMGRKSSGGAAAPTTPARS